MGHDRPSTPKILAQLAALDSAPHHQTEHVADRARRPAWTISGVELRVVHKPRLSTRGTTRGSRGVASSRLRLVLHQRLGGPPRSRLPVSGGVRRRRRKPPDPPRSTSSFLVLPAPVDRRLAPIGGSATASMVRPLPGRAPPSSSTHRGPGRPWCASALRGRPRPRLAPCRRRPAPRSWFVWRSRRRRLRDRGPTSPSARAHGPGSTKTRANEGPGHGPPPRRSVSVGAHRGS